MNNLPNFPCFDVDADKSNAGTKWEKWLGRLENLFVGMKITDDIRKRALLLHYAGEKVYDIYDVEKKETETTYDATKKVLNDYFSPKKNVQIEIYNFRTYRQTEDQTLDEFVTELKNTEQNIDEKARQNDEKSKSKSKMYQDAKCSKKQLSVGDKVLLRNENKSKMTTPYKPIPYTVTNKQGSMVTAQNSGHKITRNSSFMKKVPQNINSKLETHEREIEGEDILETLETNDTGQNFTNPERPKREKRMPKYLQDYVLK